MDLPKPILLLTEEECLGIFRFLRWRGSVYCPICGSRWLKKNGHYREHQRGWLERKRQLRKAE
jgi:uncharacterized Zn finger protein (UPF0148 family)